MGLHSFVTTVSSVLLIQFSFQQIGVIAKLEFKADSPAADQLSQWQTNNPDAQTNIITDFEGIPVPSETASETVGPGGPTLLGDSTLLDDLAHFNRERIPERVAFSNGVGAHGYFQLTADLGKYTKANILSQVGQQIPLFCRFSLALEDKGSAETNLDMRGLACKFYTSEGNWDLTTVTGLVFPIRDAILYPHLFRSHRRNPQTNLYDQNMLWDFRSQRPETIFQTLTVLSDIGLPNGYRYISTSAISTYKLVNSTGGVILAKFHLTSNQGSQNLTLQQAAVLMGTRPNYATADLFNAIATGNFPSWTLNVQLMTLEQATTYRWNPFDPTKMWMPEDFPYIPVGTITLNRNVNSYFAETEMVAFSPSNMVRGIELVRDSLSSGQMFAYKDAQRYRLGANFEQLPINRPTSPVHNYRRDGACVLDNQGSGPNYFPNGFGGPKVDPNATHTTGKIQAVVARWDRQDEDNYSQPRIWLAKLSREERIRLVLNVAFFLSFAREDVRERMYSQFDGVSSDLGVEMRAAVMAFLLFPDRAPLSY